ncbi:MAG: 1-deoxy-D-xylulose-5-phosphate synthase [Clostridia bacterium]|nr:1-deoxy-D-xylulose-5-phosphate synthase [Clostridia bacterium]
MSKKGAEKQIRLNILNDIKDCSDLKKLNVKELDSLAENLRGEILRVIDKNGGHLSSNLGIVETTISLYYNFEFPKDKILFDVGHQCYAHKILSGRKDKFDTIRLNGGISGFPDVEESEFDVFTVGHAGTSLSSAIGLATARDALGDDYTVICVVGDGAFSNGLNLEALTVSKIKPKNLIVVLNDNGMSISKNKNGFYQFISKGTTKRGYLKGKRALKKVFGNSFITKGLTKFRDFIKRMISKNDYFEQYGFKYVGVVDGNDLKELNKIIPRVKNLAKEKAVFLHVKTTKGKGYLNAEEHADLYHGVGENLTLESGSFSETLGKKLNELIEKNNKIVAITAGMKDGTGLIAVENSHPENFYDVGIAEEYAVTFASGLAKGGLKPVVAMYSTFAQRSYDQILHDVCLQNLPVVFCLDRAGVVGKDGKTHQGLFDLSFLSHMPNLEIFAPNTTAEFEDMLDLAMNKNNPVVIRYPKNQVAKLKTPSIHDGMWQVIKEGNDDKVTVIAVGPRTLSLALSVSEKLEGVGVKVVTARSVKPLDENLLEEIKNTLVISLEENSVIGGFGSAVLKYYSKVKENTKIINLGIEDKFVSHGSINEQLDSVGLSVDNIIKVIRERL